MFEWLESTKLALWVGESLWGYPIMLGSHAIGLAIVVGIFLMLDFRILGLVRGVSYAAFLGLYKIAWVGFLINALSGTALFSSQATTFVESTPFLIKISSVTLGVIVGVVLQKKLVLDAAGWDSGQTVVNSGVKMLAALSLVCWLSAIFAGRLIAYL